MGGHWALRRQRRCLVEIRKSFNGRRRWLLHVRCCRKEVHVHYLISWWVLVLFALGEIDRYFIFQNKKQYLQIIAIQWKTTRRNPPSKLVAWEYTYNICEHYRQKGDKHTRKAHKRRTFVHSCVAYHTRPYKKKEVQYTVYEIPFNACCCFQSFSVGSFVMK